MTHKPSDPDAPPATQIDFDQFLAIDIRVGTIVGVDPFPEARKPSWKLRIDFGPTTASGNRALRSPNIMARTTSLAARSRRS
jgi:tRNA-binding EMAP/Myf-like protein